MATPRFYNNQCANCSEYYMAFDDIPDTGKCPNCNDDTRRCAGCNEYYLSVGNGPDTGICSECSRYMYATAAKTRKEQFWDNTIRRLNETSLEYTDLGNCYWGFDRVQDPSHPTQQEEQTPPSAPAFEPYPMTTNVPQQPQSALPPSLTGSINGMIVAVPALQPIPYGQVPHTTPQGHVEQQQGTELQRRSTYFASKALDANVLMPGRQFPRQVKEQLDATAPVAPSMTPICAESEVLASPPKKRGTRMVCAACKKDAPVTKDNDGVNCTRCYKKLLKEYGMQ